MPGVVIRGRATFEWLEGGRVIIWRAKDDFTDIPDSISILFCGDTDESAESSDAGGGCWMHYFDSRGLLRVFAVDAEAGVWRFWRDSPGFSQRFIGTFSADGNAIAGVNELCQDGTTWVEDLTIRYRRLA